MAGKHFNIPQILLNGVAHGTKSGATIDLGGVSNEADISDGKVEGYLGTPAPCVIECTFKIDSNTAFEEIRNFQGIAEFVMLDVPGKPRYASADAILADTVSLSGGDGIKVRIIGKPAEKTK